MKRPIVAEVSREKIQTGARDAPSRTLARRARSDLLEEGLIRSVIGRSRRHSASMRLRILVRATPKAEIAIVAVFLLAITTMSTMQSRHLSFHHYVN
jgi:hypothetical protein